MSYRVTYFFKLNVVQLWQSKLLPQCYIPFCGTPHWLNKMEYNIAEKVWIATCITILHCSFTCAPIGASKFLKTKQQQKKYLYPSTTTLLIAHDSLLRH